MAKSIVKEWLTDDGLTTIRGWARDGLSKEQIANNIGIHRDTLNEWERKYPAISDSIKKGRQPLAVKIEDAFYSKCEWQTVTETRTETIGKGQKKTITTTRQIQPDTAALIFALKNLRPDKFSDKPKAQSTDDSKAFDELIKAIGGTIEDE